jgi:leader peptidase (prepilin peptidase) / N-methyltransferase
MLVVLCGVWVFIFGLGIGSFLNVLIARMPYEKSVVWPGSRCFSCLRSLRLLDNLPIIGYLRLRGKCRFCRTPFSPRYILVELGTGIGFLALFLLELLTNWLNYPGVAAPPGGLMFFLPSLDAWLLVASHCLLLALLIASAVIDLHHRIIPGHITYVGTVLGIIISTIFPWPWPNTNPAMLAVLPPPDRWAIPEVGIILNGVALWPVCGPLPSWLPPGSWQLGLVSGLFGAFVGQLTGRAVKWLFEYGLRQEALGLGDADLLMMIGAFLGWQIAIMAMPVGAIVSLPLIALSMVVRLILRQFRVAKPSTAPGEPGLPFGPGIVAGALVCWWGWPVIGEGFRIYLFSTIMMFAAIMIFMVGLLMFGFLIRRAPDEETVE